MHIGLPRLLVSTRIWRPASSAAISPTGCANFRHLKIEIMVQSCASLLLICSPEIVQQHSCRTCAPYFPEKHVCTRLAAADFEENALRLRKKDPAPLVQTWYRSTKVHETNNLRDKVSAERLQIFPYSASRVAGSGPTQPLGAPKPNLLKPALRRAECSVRRRRRTWAWQL